MLTHGSGDQFSARTTDFIDRVRTCDFLHGLWVDSHHESTHEFVAAQFPLEVRKVSSKSIYALVQQQCRVTYPRCSFRNLPHMHYYWIVNCMRPELVDILNAFGKRLVKGAEDCI